MRAASFILLLVAALLGSIELAIAQVYLESGDWVVTKDAARSTCVAKQAGNSASSGLLLERTTSGFTLTVTDRKLVWLQGGQVYDVTAIIDRSNWTGTMAADQIEGRGALKAGIEVVPKCRRDTLWTLLAFRNAVDRRCADRLHCERFDCACSGCC